MLWPLWNRAIEAKRLNRLIDDPWSIRLVDEIDYDFRAAFGQPNRGFGVRARYGDDLIKAFLKRRGEPACVVALGEGLDTAYWRLGEPEIPWFTVDVPEAIETRRSLLPEGATTQTLPFSALDFRWMDDLPPDLVPFISAAGLFMYFEEDDVRELLTQIGARFPGAELYFDTIPKIFTEHTQKGLRLTPSYRAPPMPWSISTEDIRSFLQSIPNWKAVRVRTYTEPYPLAMWPFSVWSRVGFVRRNFMPSLVHARVMS